MVRSIYEHMRDWADVYSDLTLEQRTRVRDLWPRHVHKLVRPSTRWMRVTGPMAAMQALLLDLGWGIGTP